uniref:Aminopeptidase n=1 Tax=Xenopsylla cheopis TaxID=163159 RepID=A0A6M2E291_XENCH
MVSKVTLILGFLVIGLTISTITLSVLYAEEVDKNESSTEDVTTDVTTNKPTQPPTTPPPTTPPPTTSPPTEEIDYRLPEGVKPIHYDLLLTPDLKTGKFTGYVGIDVEVATKRNDLIVHGKEIKIQNFKVLNSAGDEVPLVSKNIEADAVRDFFIIKTKDGLEPGKYKIIINYDGSLTDRIIGFYQSSYTDKDGNKRVIATSKFEPTFARLAFPSFDEPAMKAEFTVRIVRPSDDNYIALSNMNEEKAEVDVPSRGLTTVHFAKSVPMSTYLACFIVCDFKFQETDITNVDGTKFKFRSYATPAQENKLEFATETGVKVTEYYIKYFDVNYPLPKLDMIAIPDFVSGAMEHWGLVTFRETALLYDKDTSATANKQRVATVVAHEISHMWFGNLVTMDWWNELWLNEGFASYMQNKGIDEVYKDWGLLEQFLPSTVHGVMKLDGTLGSHPIVQTVETPSQITEIFDLITYDKGASVIRMLENFVGMDRFAKGVTAYLKKHQYQNAKTTDLLHQLQMIVGEEMDLTKIMDTWTRQMGLPVVTVAYGSKNGEFVLTQKRFLTDPSKENQGDPSPYNYRWEIPITYVTDKKDDYKLEWFPREDLSKTIQVDPDVSWIKLNRDQIGYYRVNYPEDMWTKLSGLLNKNLVTLTASDRAHLLNDAFSLAEATLLPYSTALTMTTYLSKEQHFVPWAVAANEFATLKTLLFETDVYDKFTEYIREIVQPVYENTKWTIEDDEKHLDKHLRVKILNLACAMGHDECLKKAGELFKDWINDGKKIPNPDLRTLVYNYGMKSAGTKENWNIVWDRFKKEVDPAEKEKLMSGLSYIQDAEVLNKYIDLAWLEENVRGQDYFSCMSSISANPLSTSMTWKYVQDNWQKMIDRFGLGERNLGRLIPSVTKQFKTDDRLKEMNEFFAKFPEAGAGAAARKQALETVANNIKWLEVNKASVADWLNNRH